MTRSQVQRPLTSDERAYLEKLAKDSEPGGCTRRVISSMGCGAGCAVAGMWGSALLGLLLRLLRIPLPGWVFLIGGLAGLAVGLMVARDAQSSRRARYDELQRDLADGQAQVSRFEALGAVEVEPSADEGPGFFLDIGEGELLFLRGQYLIELLAAGRFPNRVVELPETRVGHVSLPLLCSGEPFEVSRKRQAFASEEYMPDDREVLKGSLATLDADLRRWKAESEAGTS